MLSTAPPMQQQPGPSGTPGTPQGPPLAGTPIGPGGPQMGVPMQGGPPNMRPGSSMQPVEHTKDKLVGIIYEYLVLNGAPKTAETFKNELSPQYPNFKWAATEGNAPGYLSLWWSLFYDLYCAAPERRECADMYSSPDAKLFHDYGFVPTSFNPMAMVNGMHPQFQHSPMMGPGPDGMMPGFPGRFVGGRGGPPHPMQQFPPQMGYDPRLAAAQRGAMAGRGPPPQPGFPGMRPGIPPGHPGGPPAGMPPQMYRQSFMDGGGAPPPGAFPGMGGMPPNGSVMCSSAPPPMGTMSSPGGMPPGMQGMPHNDPRYMMMAASTSGMPMGGMPPQCIPSSSADGTPSSQHGQTAHTPLGNGPSSAGMPGPSGTPHSAGSGGGPMAGLMNGGDMKHSPAGTPRGNGGTPGPGGPGSAAPGSVHSGGVGSVPPPGGMHTPKQEPMDTNPPQDFQDDVAGDISKIKNSLLDDFEKDEVAYNNGGAF